MNTQSINTRLVGTVLTVVLCTSVATADVLTFFPTDDTRVNMYSPSTNYGASTTLVAMNRYGHPSHPTTWEQDTLIRFDLSAIPTGTDVTSAALRLYYYDYHDANPSGRELTCHRLEEDWDEDTVTWNTQPDYASEPTSVSLVPSGPTVWMEWDVTSDVQAFLDDPVVSNYGWEIRDDEYWGTYNIPRTYFRSK